MNTFKKGLFAGAAALAMSMSVQASEITVGGVSWDPDATGTFSDWFASSDFVITQQITDFSVPSTTTGMGEITKINGSTDFCDSSNCELVFTYSYDFDPSLTVAISGTGSNPGDVIQASFRNASIDFWVVDDGDFDAALSLGSAIDQHNAIETGGDLWLALEGFDLGGGVEATSFGTIGGSFASASAFLNVIDEPAALATNNFYDLKTKEVNGTGEYADMSLGFNIDTPTATGSARFNADSIPEPSTIALLGLGLLGFAGARKRKS